MTELPFVDQPVLRSLGRRDDDPVNVPAGTWLGRLTIMHGAEADVIWATAADEEASGRCRLARTLGTVPVAGDWVIVKGERVVKVLSRRNELRRTQTHGRPAQVLAANVDVVLIVIPLRGELHHRMIEGLTAMARDSGAKALIVISKSDEGPESEVEDIKRRIAALVGEVSVLVTSSHHGEGVELLRETLGPGVTGVLLGASGAGKTSLLNALEGRVERTKTLSRTGEGRHATSTRKLYRLSSGGVLLDIPGVRFSRAVADAQSSGEDYADLELLGESCRFANCHHRRDDGCAVTLAVESGELSRLRVEQWLTWREVVASSTTTPPH